MLSMLSPVYVPRGDRLKSYPSCVFTSFCLFSKQSWAYTRYIPRHIAAEVLSLEYQIASLLPPPLIFSSSQKTSSAIPNTVHAHIYIARGRTFTTTYSNVCMRRMRIMILPTVQNLGHNNLQPSRVKTQHQRQTLKYARANRPGTSPLRSPPLHI